MSGTNTSKDKAVPNHPAPSFGNPDLPPQGRLNTEGNPESLRSDGPRNEVIEGVPIASGSSRYRCQHAALFLVFFQYFAETDTEWGLGARADI